MCEIERLYAAGHLYRKFFTGSKSKTEGSVNEQKPDLLNNCAPCVHHLRSPLQFSFSPCIIIIISSFSFLFLPVSFFHSVSMVTVFRWRSSLAMEFFTPKNFYLSRSTHDCLLCTVFIIISKTLSMACARKAKFFNFFRFFPTFF